MYILCSLLGFVKTYFKTCICRDLRTSSSIAGLKCGNVDMMRRGSGGKTCDVVVVEFLWRELSAQLNNCRQVLRLKIKLF